MNTEFRNQFPALNRLHNGKPLLYFDGPAGVQVPQSVIDAISNYYQSSNANTHGAFVTTQETDALIEATRRNVAQFLGAEGPHTISFGANMTTLNYSLSKAIRRSLQVGDEILITQLDHEGNRGPWLSLRENGIVVREIKLRKNGTLDYDDLRDKLNERTRLVAVGYASNIFGTINDIKRIRELSYRVGAWLLIDAVHYAPHFSVDVQAIGCDFLLCSAYKFYGPHVGLLYCRPGLLDRLQPDRLRTTDQHAPYSIETGTLNHAALAGVNAAVDFIASLSDDKDQRTRLVKSMEQIQQHENNMVRQLYEGLSSIKKLSIVGPALDVPFRAPTLAVVVEGQRPEIICQKLAARNICAWDGHFYALRSVEVMGLLESGGVTRLGISAYTTIEEVNKVIRAFEEIAA